MHDVLCIYYSRSGHTRQVMQDVAKELNAELVEITDGVDRSGWGGWMRSGLDAMRKSCPPVQTFQTERKLENYKLVILGTPVWAGRCSSIVRSFLKQYGKKLNRVGYIITRGGDDHAEEVFEQMDHYVPNGHQMAGSLRVDSVGHAFWQDEFLRQVKEYLSTVND